MTVEELALATKERFESVERRVASLEAQDEFISRVDKLDLKPGQIVVLGTTIVLDEAARQNVMLSISRHVGFNVPVMVMDPNDVIAVLNPEQVAKKDA